MSKNSKRRKDSQRVQRAAQHLLSKRMGGVPNPLGGGLASSPSAPALQQKGMIQFNATHQVSYSGPVPPPQMLAEYDAIDPGRGAKILQLAEDQTRHRMSLENRVVSSDVHRSWAGLACGLIVTLAAIGVGGWLVQSGHDIAGGTIATGSVASLVYVFIYGTRSQRQERIEKTKILTAKR